MAEEDLLRLDGSAQPRVAKAIQKLAQNPLPDFEDGCGRPLGNKHAFSLTNLLTCKLKKDSVRSVYQIVREGETIRIVVIGARADEEVYRLATHRREKYRL